MAAVKIFAPKCVLFFLLFVFIKILDVDCGCSISIKDFGRPSPVYVKDGHFLSSDSDGIFRLKRSDVVTLACVGRGNSVAINNVTLGYDVVEAHCINNQTLRVERKIASFKDIKCLRKPTFTSIVLNKTCHTDGKIYQIGYKLKTTFHSVYEACFNEDLLVTYYVKHTLRPSKQTQQEARPNFQEGELFGKVKMSQLYKIDNQKKRIGDALGTNFSESYITKHQFLTRGHLAPRADFTLSAEIRATFHYVNAAPQWQRENAGDWRMLEDGLRRRIHELARPVTIYTGTHGVMTLSDANKRDKHIYLDVDVNNNGLVPVPMYFYKLVHDPVSRSATAFVTVNSPYYHNVDELQFCDDVCSEMSWLRWKTNDGFYSFCCSYQQFINAVSGFDKLRVHVDELFI